MSVAFTTNGKSLFTGPQVPDTGTGPEHVCDRFYRSAS